MIWMKEVLGYEVNNEGYLINCFEKLFCKVIDHQRKVEKSTVFETLSLIEENLVYWTVLTHHNSAGVKNMIELLFVCIESENANNWVF